MFCNKKNCEIYFQELAKGKSVLIIRNSSMHRIVRLIEGMI
ncbi:MAG TPA: hypothetical protein VMX55_06210 [candidate division Zixibacteria bacterium]|nr:hypothetical protein [candidate division Zixibacteria bacterium]